MGFEALTDILFPVRVNTGPLAFHDVVSKLSGVNPTIDPGHAAETISQVIKILSFVFRLVRVNLKAFSRPLVIFKVSDVVRSVVVCQFSLSIPPSSLILAVMSVSLDVDKAALAVV